MTKISFDCDRCKKPVEGLHTQSGTAGFYVVDGGTWGRFRKAGEHFICDACMHSTPEYQRIYDPVQS